MDSTWNVEVGMYVPKCQILVIGLEVRSVLGGCQVAYAGLLTFSPRIKES